MQQNVEFLPKNGRVKITSERWQHHMLCLRRDWLHFCTNLAIFVALCVNGDHSKIGKRHV